MKVALVHDYLNQFGGGERVLLSLMKLFPNAPVYTLMYDEEKTHGLFAGRVKKTSFLDFPFARRHHRLFIPLMPLAAKSIDLGGEYDLIISDSHGFSKGITYDRAKTKHISYIHTPLRYAFETANYFGHSWTLQAFSWVAGMLFNYVRNFDYRSAQRPDILIANSHYIAGKIKKYYGRQAQVVYPPISPFVKGRGPLAVRDLNFEIPPPAGGGVLPLGKGEYYLAVGRLLEYKRFDLIIEACARANVNLKIVGTGRQERALRALAYRVSRDAYRKGSIDFLPFQSDEKLRELYAGAKAFIMANEEDFGMVMAEAQSCGTPVIAYAKGGALEIVQESGGSPTSSGRKSDFQHIPTGILFKDQDSEALIAAIKRFEIMQFDRREIAKTAERFSEANFHALFTKIVKSVY